MKQIYEIAEMDVVLFAVEDIISTSGGMINGGTDTGGSDSSDFDDLFPGAS